MRHSEQLKSPSRFSKGSSPRRFTEFRPCEFLYNSRKRNGWLSKGYGIIIFGFHFVLGGGGDARMLRIQSMHGFGPEVLFLCQLK